MRTLFIRLRIMENCIFLTNSIATAMATSTKNSYKRKKSCLMRFWHTPKSIMSGMFSFGYSGKTWTLSWMMLHLLLLLFASPGTKTFFSFESKKRNWANKIKYEMNSCLLLLIWESFFSNCCCCCCCCDVYNFFVVDFVATWTELFSFALKQNCSSSIVLSKWTKIERTLVETSDFNRK